MILEEGKSGSQSLQCFANFILIIYELRDFIGAEAYFTNGADFNKQSM